VKIFLFVLLRERESERRRKSFLEDLRSDLHNKLKARRFISYLIVEIENIWLAEKRKSLKPPEEG
jgi:hypothetical protein